MEGAGEAEGQGAGGQGAQKARAQPALGDEGGAKAHQGKHQRVKAGDDLRQHQIADHAHRQREDGGADRRLIGGCRGHCHRVDEGDDAQQREPLEQDELHKKAKGRGGGVEGPFEDGLVACEHGGLLR